MLQPQLEPDLIKQQTSASLASGEREIISVPGFIITMFRKFLVFCQLLLVFTEENGGNSETQKSFSIKTEDIVRDPVMTIHDKNFDTITRSDIRTYCSYYSNIVTLPF